MAEAGLNKNKGEAPPFSEAQIMVVNLVKAMGESIRTDFNSPTHGGRRPIRLHQEYFLEQYKDRYYAEINSALGDTNQTGLSQYGYASEELTTAIATFSNLVTGSNRVFDEMMQSLMVNSLKTVLQSGLLITPAIELVSSGQSTLFYGTTHWARPPIELVQNAESGQVGIKELTLLPFSPSLAQGYLAVINDYENLPK